MCRSSAAIVFAVVLVLGALPALAGYSNVGLPLLTPDPVRIVEGSAGSRQAMLVFRLSSPSDVEVTGLYEVLDDTARVGEDFAAIQGAFTIPAGETTVLAPLTIIGDAVSEENETFWIQVIGDSGTQRVRGPAAIRGTIVDDDPSSFEIVAGGGQTGVLGRSLSERLVVQIRDINGAAVPGVPVRWEVIRGTATLDPTTSITDANGNASTRVTLGGSVGPVEVRARSGDFEAVFRLTAQSTFDARPVSPVAGGMLRPIDQICRRNDPTFTDVCAALSALSDAELSRVLEQIAPQQSGQQAKAATAGVAMIMEAVVSRLAARRAGAEGFTVQQFALGGGVPFAELANALVLSDAGGNGGERAYSGFVSATGGSGRRPADDGQLGFDLDYRAFAAGIDRRIGDGFIGAAVGFSLLGSELDDTGGEIDATGLSITIHGTRGGLFGGGSGGPYDGGWVDAALTYGRQRYDTTHIVDAPPPLGSRATASNEANVFAVTVGGGVGAHRGPLTVDLSLRGSFLRAEIDSMSEEGTGVLRLFVDGLTVDSSTIAARVDVARMWAVPRVGPVGPMVSATLVRELESGARSVSGYFIRDPLRTPFEVPIDRADATYGTLTAGVRAVFRNGYSAFLQYATETGRSDLDFHTITFFVRKEL